MEATVLMAPDDDQTVRLAAPPQHGSIRPGAGKLMKNARSDTLTDHGAVARWAEAFRHGNLCTTDVMGSVKLFEHKDDPLDEVRARFGVVPLRGL